MPEYDAASQSILCGFELRDACPIRAHTGGLFVSAERRIDTSHQSNSHELIFVKLGVVDVVEKTGTVRLHANQAILIQPASEHRLILSDPSNVAFYWILFSIDEQARGRSGAQVVSIPKATTVEEPERMLELLHWFLEDQKSGRLSSLAGSHLVALMLHELSLSVAPTNGCSGRNGSLINRIRTFIATSYDKPISTSTIAAELGYHPDYIERVFHSEVGRSLTEAIHRCRIKEARRQLVNNKKNINEIAYATGFVDPGYFRRLFRRYTDMTPSRFRSLYGHGQLKIGVEKVAEAVGERVR